MGPGRKFRRPASPRAPSNLMVVSARWSALRHVEAPGGQCHDQDPSAASAVGSPLGSASGSPPSAADGCARHYRDGMAQSRNQALAAWMDKDAVEVPGLVEPLNDLVGEITVRKANGTDRVPLALRREPLALAGAAADPGSRHRTFPALFGSSAPTAAPRSTAPPLASPRCVSCAVNSPTAGGRTTPQGAALTWGPGPKPRPPRHSGSSATAAPPSSPRTASNSPCPLRKKVILLRESPARPIPTSWTRSPPL